MPVRRWETPQQFALIRREPWQLTEWLWFRPLYVIIITRWLKLYNVTNDKINVHQGGRHELPKIRDLPQQMGVLVTQGISVNSSYSSDIKVRLSANWATHLTPHIHQPNFDVIPVNMLSILNLYYEGDQGKENHSQSTNSVLRSHWTP